MDLPLTPRAPEPPALASVPERARRERDRWRALLAPVLDSSAGAVVATLRRLARETGIPYATLRRRYYAVRREGSIALLDRRICGPAFWRGRRGQVEDALPPADRQLVRLYCERNGRSSAAALRELRADWRAGRVRACAELDASTGYPRGWSLDNLRRHMPTRYELKAARIGRRAADAERPLVYTTRAGLWVASHYLFDDLWHDTFVGVPGRKQQGRPLEFRCLDLFSGCMVAWGVTVRLEREDGTMAGLNERQMRFLVAKVLTCDGYSPRGTELVLERRTATLPRALADLIAELTGGLVTTRYGGILGRPAHGGQFAPEPKGNPRFKAAIESHGNLVHNELAALPGHTGPDRDRRPEELAGRLDHSQWLLDALAALPTERAALARLPLLHFAAFADLLAEAYDRINARVDHDLEGWEQCGHVAEEIRLAPALPWVPVPATAALPDAARAALGALVSADPALRRVRKLSPTEAWERGAGGLRRLGDGEVCLILGPDLGVERRVRRQMFEFEDADVGPGPHRYLATVQDRFGHRVLLRDGGDYLTFVNPFDPSRLLVQDAAGRYVGACPRLQTPCRGDEEAVHRAMGASAAVETALLADQRARHLAAGEDARADVAHNRALVRGWAVTPDERARERADARLLRAEERAVTEKDVEDLLAPGESACAPAVEDTNEEMGDYV